MSNNLILKLNWVISITEGEWNTFILLRNHHYNFLYDVLCDVGAEIYIKVDFPKGFYFCSEV